MTFKPFWKTRGVKDEHKISITYRCIGINSFLDQKILINKVFWLILRKGQTSSRCCSAFMKKFQKTGNIYFCKSNLQKQLQT